jgi:hypothetical protein
MNKAFVKESSGEDDDDELVKVCPRFQRALKTTSHRRVINVFAKSCSV